MKLQLRRLLKSLNIKLPEELIGKTLKLTTLWSDTGDRHGNTWNEVLYVQISSFTISDNDIEFPPITHGDGINLYQVTLSEKFFTISMIKFDSREVVREYQSNVKPEKNVDGIAEASFEII